MSGRQENVSVQIRKTRGNNIPMWYGACEPWNFVTEMVLRMTTSGLTRSGNENADKRFPESHAWTAFTISRCPKEVDCVYHHYPSSTF